MVQSNQHPLNIITDHTATKGVVKHSIIQTTDLTKANPKLINTTNYLSKYETNFYYIPRKINVILDTLSRLPVFIARLIEDNPSGDLLAEIP